MTNPKPSVIVPSPDDLLDSKATQVAAGGRGAMTLHRWQKDPDIAFPPPDLTIGGKNFWRRRTIVAWVDWMQARQSAPKPSADVKRVQAKRMSPGKSMTTRGPRDRSD